MSSPARDSRLHFHRYQLWQMAGDAVLVALAYFLAFQLRFLDEGWTIPERFLELFVGSVGFVVVGKVAIFYAFGLYQKWWRFVGGRDYVRVAQAVAVASLILVVAFAVLKPFAAPLPRTVGVFDFLLTLMLIAGVRLGTRLLKERPERGSRIPRGREMLVVGAGQGGQMVVRELKLNPNLGETAIGFVDDNPGMTGMKIQGISVLGTTDEIESILDETEPDGVVIAIPSAPGALRGKVVAACRERQIPVRTLPTVFELLRGGVQLSQQLREVKVEDVLGRDPVVVELARVGAYLEDQVVLVTGAGGSIGSELCRQVLRFHPQRILLVDHSENGIFAMEQEFSRLEPRPAVEFLVAGIGDEDRMQAIMG
ncbi:MAG: polysaccharide biosynthesis protein, partial [Solirubrobacterales bacterium]